MFLDGIDNALGSTNLLLSPLAVGILDMLLVTDRRSGEAEQRREALVHDAPSFQKRFREYSTELHRDLEYKTVTEPYWRQIRIHMTC